MRTLSIFSLLLASLTVRADALSPEQATKAMKLPAGFSARLVAAEPDIRQPLSMSFDERGRLWVLQYLQYPNPAGLKALKQDQFLRTVWDRVPEPPPHGPRGLDRITILSDPDEQGRFRKSKDFLTGLNLATGFCIGNGGVYVVQPPYLLFYADRNHDDVPDGDPEVLLTGFGMEDTHSYANSLQWGPDGWLYGAHGSTVTAKIKCPTEPTRVIEFQQGVWRYHPATKRFELFAEGGGNTYGLDFDKHGQCIAGTNWGGLAMLHHVQGGYYVKGFSKHGPLHNPHTYGYFDHVPYQDFKGGHVTCGGVVYQADAYPKEMHDQYIAGNLLSNAIHWHYLTPKGPSFTARHGGELMTTPDIWFRPVDCYQGPDGCVYVADWYDKRAAHLDPVDNWDKTNGRVYRIEYKSYQPVAPFDLRKKTSAELVDLLRHTNKWYRNEARRLLAERADRTVVARLREQVVTETGLLALESLWALYQLQGVDDELALRLMGHPFDQVRSWVVRFLGDRTTPLSTELAHALDQLAAKDPSLKVLSQLACTAKRVDPAAGLKIASSLAARPEVNGDNHLSTLIWWAIEPQFDSPSQAMSRFRLPADGAIAGFLAERIARRTANTDLANESTASGLPHTSRLLLDARPEHRPAMLRGVELALDGQRFDRISPELQACFDALQKALPADENLFRLRARFGHGDALTTAIARLSDAKRSDAEKVKLIQLLGQVRRPEARPTLVQIVRESKVDALRGAALSAVAGTDDPALDAELINLLPRLSGAFRQQVIGRLFSRATTALQVLEQVDTKKMTVESLPVELVRPVLALKDERIDKLVLKHWGKIGAATPGEKQARISWLRAELGRGKSDANHGKELFTKNCSACHQLFGEGTKLGPDLTSADRKNRDYLLTHIVDPSLYVRPEFMQYNVVTLDGRRLAGVVGESTEASVSLITVVENKQVKTQIAKKDIDEMLPSAVSLMPEKLLDTLSYQDVRDLFAYLQLTDPKSPAPAKEAPKAPAKDTGKKLTILLISGSLEYKSDESLAAFQKYLEEKYPIQCVRAFRKTDEDLPGLEQLEKCDVAIFYTRRLKITGEQLDRVKKYVASGKPIIGVRTASHGFQNWLEMDKEVFGGDYKNHYGANLKCEVTIGDTAKDHPVLKGVKPFVSEGSLYKNPNVAADVTVLMAGSIPKQSEPVTWVRERKGARVFYTSLGHPKDFEEASFRKLLTNAIFWTTGQPIPE